MTQEAILFTREQVLEMEPLELGIEVAQHIFRANVIRKEDCPDSRLLIGHFGYKAWQPLSGERWENASWRNSDENAWLDCPRYGEDISATWKMQSVLDQDPKIREQYAIELQNVLELNVIETTPTLDNIYQIVHATPAQRCKAALLTFLNLKSHQKAESE